MYHIRHYNNKMTATCMALIKIAVVNVEVKGRKVRTKERGGGRTVREQ